MENETKLNNDGSVIFLNDCRKNNKTVKILFRYPDSTRSTKRTGKILLVSDTHFILDEIYQGQMCFSYQYIVEMEILKDGDYTR